MQVFTIMDKRCVDKCAIAATYLAIVTTLNIQELSPKGLMAFLRF